MEANIICDIYDTIWDYIQDKTKDLVKEDILTALIVKVLDKEFVNDFIDNLVVKYKINDKLEEAWNNNFKTKSLAVSTLVFKVSIVIGFLSNSLIISFIAVHFLNALLPILVTLFGIVMLVRLLQP